ncbi:MAG: hypothetical protein PWQ73_240 [Petrotoga sp.]|nr:hypothetical protein [Petrotoga sp.]
MDKATILYIAKDSIFRKTHELILYVLYGVFFVVLYQLFHQSNVDLIPFEVVLLSFSYGLLIFVTWLFQKNIIRYWKLLVILMILPVLMILLYNPPGNFMFPFGDEYTYYLFFNNPDLKPPLSTSYLYIRWLQIWKKWISWSGFRFINLLSYISSVGILFIVIKQRYGKKVAKLSVFLMMFSPLEIWFANSYYKESLYILMFSLLVWCLHNSQSRNFTGRFYSFTFIDMVFSLFLLLGLSLIRSYSIVLSIPIFLYVTSLKNVRRVKKVIFSLFIVLILTIGLIFYYYNAINQGDFALTKMTIYRGLLRIGLTGSILSNIMSFFSSLVLALFLPLPYIFTNKETVYTLLDYISCFEGFISIIILPYAFLTITQNFLRRSHDEKDEFSSFLVWIYLVMILGIALSGYVFTYRHYVGFRWILYILSAIGKHRIKSDKIVIKRKRIFEFLVFFMVILINAYRYFYPRS